MPALIPRGSWDAVYRSNQTPWDTGRPDPQLKAYLAANLTPGRRVLELGCGTGTNAVFLARRGFLVTAFDLSKLAIARAKRKAKEASTTVDFLVRNATRFNLSKHFDWAFDRGCYHSLSKPQAAKYRASLLKHLDPGSHLLLLCFSDKEPLQQGRGQLPASGCIGPRRISKADLIHEFGAEFEIRSIADFRFDPNLPGFSPHGYAVLLVKK